MRLSRLQIEQVGGAIASLLLMLLAAPSAPGNTLDVSLNVDYAIDTDPLSGGTWQLVGKSGGFGIFSLNVQFTGVATISSVAPTGTVDGSVPAGLDIFETADFGDYDDVLLAHRPLPVGTAEQNKFYGIGTLSNGSPDYPGKPVGSNFIGPVFTTLTNVDNVPWADTPDPFGDPAWDIAARLLTGTFSPGATPGFYNGPGADSSGVIFSAVGSSSTSGPISFISTLTSAIVRTDLIIIGGADADYNNDGFVNAADYTVWRNTVGTAMLAADGSGPGGVPDGIIDRFDYDFWKEHYGETVPGAGTGAIAGDSTVPEPTSGSLLALGLLLSLGRARFGGRANGLVSGPASRRRQPNFV